MWKWMAVAGLCSIAGVSSVEGQAALSSAPPRRQILNAVVTAGRLSFDGRANVGDFTGTTTTVSGELVGGEDITLVRGWVEAPVQTLVTGNGKRDRDLTKSMESDRYPTIRFELAGVTIRSEAGDTAKVDLQGRFLIHGVVRDVVLPATLVLGGAFTAIRADTPLNLKDYNIGGLSKAFGMLRMYPDILVHIDVTFASGTAVPAAGAKG
jgi:polyisoprenoid-binding protein YceI